MTTLQQGTLRPPVSASDHVLGEASAPITLVEYGDFQCPHCARAHKVIAAVRKRLGARLRFVFRNFPLTEIHPDALDAAEAAESVAAHAGNTAYWKMHDALFDHAQEAEDALDLEHLVRYAAASGAAADDVARDLEADAFESRVKADFMSGVRSGVNGTPTFFINGQRFDGDWSSAAIFAAALEAVEA
ncbi:MAG: Na+/H+ antiporter NhaA [Gemmatimonadetes bacterium]|nr:Na+/H+ antiporter NhaA [Gemmatimonadota bacterium]